MWKAIMDMNPPEDLVVLYNYNNRAMRLQGQRGDLMPDNETRNIIHMLLI